MDPANLFIDLDTFDVENIQYIKPISFLTASRDMGIYYYTPPKKKEKKGRKQKIIVETPKMMVPCAHKEFVSESGKKNYRMCLSFSTLTNIYNEEELQRFHDFTTRIDENNEEIVDENRKNWKLPSSMVYKPSVRKITDNFPDVIEIVMPYTEKDGFLFHVYDEKAGKSSMDIITKQSIVTCILELTDLTFRKKMYHANWKLLQIRKSKNYSPIQEYFMSGCFICDKDDPEDVAYDNMIAEYQKKMGRKNKRTELAAIMAAPSVTAPIQMMQMMQQMMNMPAVVPMLPGIPPGPMTRGGPPPPPPPMGSQSKGPARGVAPPPKKEEKGTTFQPPSASELIDAKKILRSVPQPEKKVFKSIYSEDKDEPKVEAVSSDEKTKSEEPSKTETKADDDVRAKTPTKVSVDDKVNTKTSSKASVKSELQGKSKKNKKSESSSCSSSSEDNKSRKKNRSSSSEDNKSRKKKITKRKGR